MTTKDMGLECYGTNLELADKAMYEHLYGEYVQPINNN